MGGPGRYQLLARAAQRALGRALCHARAVLRWQTPIALVLAACGPDAQMLDDIVADADVARQPEDAFCYDVAKDFIRSTSDTQTG